MTISRSLQRLWDEYNDYFENDCKCEIYSKEKRKEALKSCLAYSKYKLIQHGNKHIGFVMWGDPLYPHKYQFNYEITIFEAYIKPEYRNQGIMTQQISYIVNHPIFSKKRVCLFVLDQNKIALSIWELLFKKLNFRCDGEITRTTHGKWFGFSRD